MIGTTAPLPIPGDPAPPIRHMLEDLGLLSTKNKTKQNLRTCNNGFLGILTSFIYGITILETYAHIGSKGSYDLNADITRTGQPYDLMDRHGQYPLFEMKMRYDSS